MTKTTIFLSFLLLLLCHANSESQLNEKEQTVLLKLKQHWQNPPSLSHWQNPLSLSHLNSINSSPTTVTGQRSLAPVEQSPNYYFKTRTSPKQSHPSSVTSRTSQLLTFRTTSFLKSFLKRSITVSGLKTLTSHKLLQRTVDESCSLINILLDIGFYVFFTCF